MGIVGQLGLAKSRQPHVVLPVQVAQTGVFQPQIPGKFAVYGGVSAVHVLPGFFKMDVEGVLPQAAAHGQGEDLPVLHKHGAFHLQPLIMPQRPGQGNAFQHIVPRRVGLHPGAVPLAHHMLGSG